MRTKPTTITLDARGQPVAVVFHRHGRWIAWCPRPDCTSIECFGKDDSGQVGGLAGGFRCRPEKGGCGFLCGALWPEHVQDIERLLICRPVLVTRNWEPGEDLSDLLAENAEHGILPVSREVLEAGRAGEPIGRVLTIGEDGIRGELGASTVRHAIEAGR